MTPEQISEFNAERLAKLYQPMQPKIAAIISDMNGHGWHTLIDSLVWRTKREQEQLFREGKSKIMFSFHNCTNPDGTPGSLAADMTDARFPFEEPLQFKLMLAAAAMGHGLMTGIEFGLALQPRKLVRNAVLMRNFDIKGLEIGWDPWHVQPATISIASARGGARPDW